MNIWILNHYAITPDMPGSTRHYDFGKELLKRGHEVTIFASSFLHHGERKELKLLEGEKWKMENVDGINFVWLKTFSYQKNNWRRIINMLFYMHRSYWLGKSITQTNHLNKPDIIIGSSPQLLSLLSSYWLAKHYRVKYIAELRDLWPQNLIDIGELRKNSSIARILRLLEKYLYKHAAKIILLSPAAKSYLTSLGINQNNLCVIPNGVDLSLYNNNLDNKQEKGNIFKIMYTGTLGVFYELDQLLKTAKIVQDKGYKDIKFIFVGSGVKKLELIEKSKELKLKNIQFVNPVPKIKMPSVLKDAGAFLLKRNKIFYGSSNKLMDYMASKKPVIFSTSTNDSVAQKAECGLSVTSGKAEDFAKSIINLYKMSPKQRAKMGQNGRRYVEKYYNIPVLATKLEEVIHETTN